MTQAPQRPRLMIAPSSQNAMKKTTTGTHSVQVPSAPSATVATLSPVTTSPLSSAESEPHREVQHARSRARRARPIAPAARAVAARTRRLGRLDEDRLRCARRGSDRPAAAAARRARRRARSARRTASAAGVPRRAPPWSAGVRGGGVVGVRLVRRACRSTASSSTIGSTTVAGSARRGSWIDRLGGRHVRSGSSPTASRRGGLGVGEALLGAADDVVDRAGLFDRLAVGRLRVTHRMHSSRGARPCTARVTRGRAAPRRRAVSIAGAARRGRTARPRAYGGRMAPRRVRRARAPRHPSSLSPLALVGVRSRARRPRRPERDACASTQSPTPIATPSPGATPAAQRADPDGLPRDPHRRRARELDGIPLNDPAFGTVGRAARRQPRLHLGRSRRRHDGLRHHDQLHVRAGPRSTCSTARRRRGLHLLHARRRHALREDVVQNEPYPVTDGRTLFWRDDILIDTHVLEPRAERLHGGDRRRASSGSPRTQPEHSRSRR